MNATAAATGLLVGTLVVALSAGLGAASRRVRRRTRGLLSTTVPVRRPTTDATRERNPSRRWRMGGAALAAGLIIGGLPVLGVSMGLAVWVLPRWRHAADRRRHETALQREVPDVVDLLLVATASGLNLSLAVAAVGERGPPLIGAAFARAAAEIDGGTRIADGIEGALAPLGGPVRPLAATLLGTARYGTALGPALDRLSLESRQLRRRHAEEAARRVPVKLLFPLVVLVLPAFVLLTLVPLLAGALRSLHL